MNESLPSIKATIRFTKYAKLLIFLIKYVPMSIKLGIYKYFSKGMQKNPYRYIRITFDKPPDKSNTNHSKGRTEAQKGQ